MSTIPQAGGMETWGKAKADQRPGSAKDYGPFLLHKGFKEVSAGNYQKGDISVIESFTNNPHGHIAMWNGENWVSDFVQKLFIQGMPTEKQSQIIKYTDGNK